jgi:hypothetical protein
MLEAWLVECVDEPLRAPMEMPESAEAQRCDAIALEKSSIAFQK